MWDDDNQSNQPHFEELLREIRSQLPWNQFKRAMKPPKEKPEPRPRRKDRIEKDGAFRNGPEPIWKAARRALLLESVRLRHIPVEEASKVLGIGRSTAYRWMRAYLDEDVNKMRDRRYCPRKKKETPYELSTQ